MTTIRYFIPEDGDDETHPNVFLAPKPRQQGAPPTLGQVKDAFPLPGVYHFRFKSPLFPGGDRDKGAMAVWMDSVHDQAPVPTWKNSIVAKVTRLSAEEDDDDDDDDFIAKPAPTPARAPPSHQGSVVSAGSADHLDIFDGPSPSGSVQSSMAPSMGGGGAPAAGNLLDGNSTSGHAPPPNVGGSSGSTLLDMDGYGTSTAAPPPAAHNDFLGMTAPPPATPVAPVQSGGGGGYPGATPHRQPNTHHHYGHPTPQTAPRGPTQQQNAFDSFSNQQGPFGGLGTPWK